MEDPAEVENDRRRAEVFDALGHPARIAILKALNEGALGFADLKKKIGIESSGHLQHHLTKLDGLIRTDEHGKYRLSDQGKDALVTVQTVENASISKTTITGKIRLRRFNTKTVLKSVSSLLMVLLIASSAVALFEYNQMTILQKQIRHLEEMNQEALAYYNEFGAIPKTNVNSSFSPPISMYRALQIGLEEEGWNKTSLEGMQVSAYLYHWMTITNITTLQENSPTELNLTSDPATSPSIDYSPIYGNGVIYRYVWEIIVTHMNGVLQIPPPGFSMVDAATGQILPDFSQGQVIPDFPP